MDKTFDPKFQYHEEETGKLVSVTINDETMHTLAPGEKGVISLNYENKDVDDDGFITYMDKYQALSQINAILGDSDSFERPEIIDPSYNETNWNGKLSASAFTAKTPGVTHVKTVWEFSWYPDFDDTSRPLKDPSDLVVTNGDLTKGFYLITSTKSVFVRVTYYGSDGSHLTSLPRVMFAVADEGYDCSVKLVDGSGGDLNVLKTSTDKTYNAKLVRDYSFNVKLFDFVSAGVIVTPTSSVDRVRVRVIRENTGSLQDGGTVTDSVCDNLYNNDLTVPVNGVITVNTTTGDLYNKREIDTQSDVVDWSEEQDKRSLFLKNLKVRLYDPNKFNYSFYLLVKTYRNGYESDWTVKKVSIYNAYITLGNVDSGACLGSYVDTVGLDSPKDLTRTAPYLEIKDFTHTGTHKYTKWEVVRRKKGNLDTSTDEVIHSYSSEFYKTFIGPGYERAINFKEQVPYRDSLVTNGLISLIHPDKFSAKSGITELENLITGRGNLDWSSVGSGNQGLNVSFNTDGSMRIISTSSGRSGGLRLPIPGVTKTGLSIEVSIRLVGNSGYDGSIFGVYTSNNTMLFGVGINGTDPEYATKFKGIAHVYPSQGSVGRFEMDDVDAYRGINGSNEIRILTVLSSTDIKFYINGKLAYTTTNMIADMNNCSFMMIASDDREFNQNYEYDLTWVRIYNRVLTEDEALYNHNKGLILPTNINTDLLSFYGSSSVLDRGFETFKTRNSIFMPNDNHIGGYVGLPVNHPEVQYTARKSDVYDMYVRVTVGLHGDDPSDIVELKAGYTRFQPGVPDKYESGRRLDLFSNSIFKFPFLTKDSSAESNITFLNRKLVYPVNPSKTILSPLGNPGSVLSEYQDVPNTSISESLLMYPSLFNEYSNDDLFNYTVFENIDQLVDLIYSLSFHREVDISYPSYYNGLDSELDKHISSKRVRRPIVIYCNSERFTKITNLTEDSSYTLSGGVGTTAPYWTTFELTKPEIKGFLEDKGFTPDNFKLKSDSVKRRLAIEIYDKSGEPSRLIGGEALCVAFASEITEYFNGHDGYLDSPLDLTAKTDLDYPYNLDLVPESPCFPMTETLSYIDSNYTSITQNGFRVNRLHGGDTDFSNPKTYLEVFKMNFDFYGLIPFRLCTEKSLLGFKGHFVHREEGYEKGQEVVHPVTNDLYVCIKDRPGIQNMAKYNIDEYEQVLHNYPIGTPTYSVLEDTTYFKKVCSFDNSEVLTGDEYKELYKSSLPTYTALLSYLNLILPAHEGLLFNPHCSAESDGLYSKSTETTSPSSYLSRISYCRVFPYDNVHHGDSVVTYRNMDFTNTNFQKVTHDKGPFPYTYLNKYFEAYDRNETIKDYSSLTDEDETRHAMEDVLFGGWFKFKNKNYNNFIYLSSRPVLWVKDKKTIASANIVHPRQHIIRIGTKHYYVRLMVDNFYPDDDCCLEPDVLGGIPSIHPDFTAFNDPYCLNFRESLLNNELFALFFKASSDVTGVTKRSGNVVLSGSDYPLDSASNLYNSNVVNNNLMSQPLSIDKIYKLTTSGTMMDRYCFINNTLYYNSTPSENPFNDTYVSGRKLDNANLGTSTSDVTYNIENMQFVFEIGSDSRFIQNNEIVYDYPVVLGGFNKIEDSVRGARNSLSNYVLYNYESDGKLYIRHHENISNSAINDDSFFSNLEYDSSGINGSGMSQYHPVHVVLEAIEEEDLPIYNIKDSLVPFLKEPSKKSLEDEINSGNMRNTSDQSYLLSIVAGKDRKVYSENSTVPSWDYGRKRPNIPEILNGGYHIDRVRDIDYVLQTGKLKDMVNYVPKKGLTPDTYYNYDNLEMWYSQNRKTYGNINLDEFKIGSWGSYSMKESTTSDREVKVKVYDRWSGTGYLGSLDSLSGLGDSNILNPQLERILKHKLVNNEANRNNDINKYPIIHIYYFKGKIMLIPNDLPFDLYHPELYGYNYTKDMEYLEYGRTKPVDRFTRNVNRVKLGNNIFDVMLPYLANDRSLHSNQELVRDIIPTLYHKNPRS